MSGLTTKLFKKGHRSVAVAQFLAVLVPLAVYLRTLAREVTFSDSGELAAAVARLGIAHPPGYPFYTLIGNIFTLLPMGSVAFRVGLLSAVAGAVTTGFLFRAAWILVGSDTQPGWPRRLTAFGALSGTFLYAFAATPWSQAVIVEVYALHSALVMAFLIACLGVISRIHSTTGTRNLMLVGLLFGLSLTHHLTAALLGLAFAATLVFFSIDRRRIGALPYRGWLRAVLAVPVPMFLYIYLPLRSRMDPQVNWDYPETWHRLIMHISARQYQGIWGREGLRLGELYRFVSEQLFSDATPVLPTLAVLGLVILARERSRVLWLTVPVFVAQVVYNLGYPIEDIQVYYLMVILLLSLWAAVATAWIGRRVSHLKVPVAVLVILCLFLFPVFALKKNFARNDLSRYQVTSAFAYDVAGSAEPGCVIFSGAWEWFSGPMVYLQNVEQFRTDIVVVDIGRLAAPMLARDLERIYPELAAACREQLAAMAKVTRKAELGESYDVKGSQELYRSMQLTLVRESVRLRPTYALGFAFQHDMFAGLQQHPEGLLMQLTNDTEYRAFTRPRYMLPELLAGRQLSPRERDLLSLYSTMLEGRVRYLEHHDQAAEARALRSYLTRIRR